MASPWSNSGNMIPGRLAKRILATMFLRITTLLTLSASSLFAANDNLNWKPLPDLPGGFGVAGPFAGTQKNALIIAGGANFPNGEPWRPTDDGGTSAKIYHDTIYIVTKDDLDYSITEAKHRLPHVLGYGVSISTNDADSLAVRQLGVLCIGGEWQEGGLTHRSAKVFAISYASDKITIDENYPTLAQEHNSCRRSIDWQHNLHYWRGQRPRCDPEFLVTRLSQA